MNVYNQEEEKVGKIRSWWEAPRWAGVESAIKNLAWELGLECETEVDKGFINETGRYWVSGTESKLKEFKHRLKLAIKNYNG
mgnify:CR=1 FL=1